MDTYSSYLSEIEDQIKRLKIRENIEIILNAKHELVLHYMAMSDIFVLPSIREPFEIALLEAALAGLPIIATNVDGIPEVVGETGAKLVPPCDSTALVRAINSLLEDSTGGQEMVHSMNPRIRKQFTWVQSAKSYRDLYSEFG